MALSAQQLTALNADILAAVDAPMVAARSAGATGAVADLYNASVPAFIVWKSSVTIRETGQSFNGAEWAGMTTANHTRLQTVAQYLMTYNPGLADIRAMFNDIWSGAGGAVTRAALLALWKRAAKRGEQLFATGAGTDVSPATLVFEGNVTNTDVVSARSGW